MSIPAQHQDPDPALRLELLREAPPHTSGVLTFKARVWKGNDPVICATAVMRNGSTTQPTRVMTLSPEHRDFLDFMASALAVEDVPSAAIRSIVDSYDPSVERLVHRDHFVLEARSIQCLGGIWGGAGPVADGDWRNPVGVVAIGNFDASCPLSDWDKMTNRFSRGKDRDGAGWLLNASMALSFWPRQGLIRASYDLAERVSGREIRPHGWNGLPGTQASPEIYAFWKLRLADRGVDADDKFEPSFVRDRIRYLGSGEMARSKDWRPAPFYEDLDRRCAERIAAFHARRDPRIPGDVRGWRERQSQDVDCTATTMENAR